MLEVLFKYRRHYVIFSLISLLMIFDSFALDYKPHTIEDWERIIIVVGIIITIVSPSKYRIMIIGVVLGLMFSYFTYKYIVPALINF